MTAHKALTPGGGKETGKGRAGLGGTYPVHICQPASLPDSILPSRLPEIRGGAVRGAEAEFGPSSGITGLCRSLSSGKQLSQDWAGLGVRKPGGSPLLSLLLLYPSESPVGSAKPLNQRP